ncbi:hypothetical protein Hte_000125 [Hypoxylon texense]
MPSLTTIPLEILIQISALLETPDDFGALRLTCKYIEASLFKTFAWRYFNDISFSRIEHSLRAFVNISKSRLSPFLKYVAIHSELVPTKWVSDDDLNINTSDLETILRYRQRRADQRIFLNTCQDQSMLAEAFCNLSHLEQVIIQGPRRRPYFRDDYDTYEGQEIISRMSNASCLQNVLCALARSGIELKQLKIDMYAALVRDDAFNIPSFMEEAILPVLVHLEALDIRFLILDESVVARFQEQKLQKINAYYLRKFLLRATQIKHLCLGGMNKESFSEWLSGPVSNEQYNGPSGLESPISPTFMNLHEFTLIRSRISSNSLLAIIQKFSATMRELYLDGVLLRLSNFGEWPEFVAQLARTSRHLRKISLEHVRVDIHFRHDRSIRRRHVEFNKPGERKFVYAGDRMEDVLEGLVDVILTE